MYSEEQTSQVYSNNFANEKTNKHQLPKQILLDLLISFIINYLFHFEFPLGARGLAVLGFLVGGLLPPFAPPLPPFFAGGLALPFVI